MAPYRDEVQQRHMFHMALDEPAPERWLSTERDPSDGSGAHRFECYWIPVAQGHVLSGGQGSLLGRIHAVAQPPEPTSRPAPGPRMSSGPTD